MKRRLSGDRFVWAWAVILVATTACAAVARADGVDDYVRAQMASKHIPGMAVAVVKNGKPVKVQGYGVANLELNVPVNPDTVFFIGSVSKQIIATAVMMLVNDGKLSLDDKVVKFFDGAPEIWNDITVRHLLTHTAGLVREGPGFQALKVQSDAEVIKSAYGTPLVFKTGERWQYSNLGYFMLAEIVAKVSGTPWPQFVEQRIFGPLKMEASGAVDGTSIVANRADSYGYRNDQYQNALPMLALRPSGAFMSNLNDLLKWNAALDNATLLPQSRLDEMWTKVILNDGKPYPYGFGFVLDKLGTHRMVEHGGSLLGFRSDYLRLPEDKLSVIVLANSAGAPVDAIAAGIAAQYVKDLFPGREPIKLSTAQLDAVAGSYRFGSGNLTTLTREGNGLRFVSPRIGLDSLLLPASPTVFFSTDDPRMHVEVKGSGPATRLTSYMNGTEQSSGGREPTQEERMASFAANDRNKDGKLDKTEYHELLKPLGFGDQVDALFQQRDVNKDAFVSAEEYRTPMQ